MILCADFGGTTIKMGIVREGIILARDRLRVEDGVSMAAHLELVAQAWETLLSKAGVRKDECHGIALSLPFIADRHECRVSGDFGKLSGAAETDFGAWSQKRFGLPLVLENDLRMALLGEWKSGAARGKSDVVMLAFGTGIGCAVISSGQLLWGAHNRAASIFGHSTISIDHGAGRCGNIGCAEDLASTATLTDRAHSRADFCTSSLALAERVDFETVFAQAQSGDACSKALLDQSLRVWAVVVLNTVLAYDPEIVVLGGGVLRSHQVIIPAIHAHIRTHAPCLPPQIQLAVGELGDDAALLGGEALFYQSKNNRS